jgi:polyisoprenoid-binding protein YceI
MFYRIFTVLALLLSFNAFAQNYQLDAQQSSLYVVSVKNHTIVETHHFSKLSGAIDQQGKAQLIVDLASVQTHIELRDQRMRDLFFHVAGHPYAKVNVALEPDFLKALKPGFNQVKTLVVELDLHGKQKTYTQAVRVTVPAKGIVQVTLEQPIVLNTADFGLTEGVEVLRDLAKLDAILPVVPVSATLVYRLQK